MDYDGDKFGAFPSPNQISKCQISFYSSSRMLCRFYFLLIEKDLLPPSWPRLAKKIKWEVLWSDILWCVCQS